MRKSPKIPWHYLRLAAFFAICGLVFLLVVLFLPRNDSGEIIIDYAYATPVLGVVVDRQMQILQVEAGSAAEKAGLKAGDILTGLDGVAVKTSEELKQKMRLKFSNPTGETSADPKASSTFKIGYKRNNQPAELTAILITPGVYAHPGPTATAIPANQDYL